MSRLITSGDTIANFGELLPAPYIEQIYIGVDADSGYGTIDIALDIYVTAPEGADDEVIIKGVWKYYIYWHALSTSTKAAAGSSTTEANWDIDKLIDKKYSIWEIGYTDEGAGWSGGKFQLFNLIPEDGDLPEYEVVYDDAGNRLLKFTYSSADEEDTLVLDIPDKGSASLYGSEGVIWNDEGEEYDSDVYLFAWSTAKGAPPPASGVSGLRPPDGFVLPSDEDIAGGRWTTFLDLQTSDVAYELVWTDGAPAAAEEPLWVDGDGNAFDGTPLQSISSQYYSTSGITHSEIVSSFENLLEEYEDLGETDNALQDVIDQIAYILATHKESEELLTQLNLLLRAFPSKSSVTNVGSLYIDYREKVYTANAAIEIGIPLFRKIITNTKVIDLRGLDFEWSGVSDDEARRTTDTAFPLVWLDDSAYMTTNMKIGRTSFFDSNGTQYWNDYGFFFFDYDKALYETAAIGEYFSMSGLFNIFGKDFLNKYFRLSKAVYIKYDSYASYTEHYRITADFKDDDGDSVGYKINNIDHAAATYALSAYGTPYVYDSDTDEVAYSFVMLRNFQPAKEGGLDGYRLMCFEFQDLRKVVDTAEGLARGSVWVDDGTLGLVGEIIAAYASAQEDFQDYYDLATEACVFNTIDAKWKDSFIEEMHNTYDSDIGNAPWIYYPVFYCLHQDLLTKEFGGDLTLLMEEASRISAKINPDYGSQTELEIFKNNFDELYDMFYAEGADESGGDLSAVAEDNSIDDYTTRYYFTTWENDDLDSVDEVYEYTTDDALSDVTAYVATASEEFAAADVSASEIDADYLDPAYGEYAGSQADGDSYEARWLGYGSGEGAENPSAFYDADLNEIPDNTDVSEYIDFYQKDDTSDTPTITKAVYRRHTSRTYSWVKIVIGSDLEGGEEYIISFRPEGWTTETGDTIADVHWYFWTANAGGGGSSDQRSNK